MAAVLDRSAILVLSQLAREGSAPAPGNAGRWPTACSAPSGTSVEECLRLRIDSLRRNAWRLLARPVEPLPGRVPVQAQYACAIALWPCRTLGRLLALQTGSWLGARSQLQRPRAQCLEKSSHFDALRRSGLEHRGDLPGRPSAPWANASRSPASPRCCSRNRPPIGSVRCCWRRASGLAVAPAGRPPLASDLAPGALLLALRLSPGAEPAKPRTTTS
jgi:hypothetical protein